MRLETHSKPISVSTPVGDPVIARQVYKNCPFIVSQRVTSEDLVVLESLDFDVIIGMISKGYLNHLVWVKDSRHVTPALESVPVFSEFPEVFPKDLPGVTHRREINFRINLLSNTQPISIHPYRMDPVELKELKEQLKDLLDKCFIKPSISPWGAPMLFVKKKDGSLKICIDYRK